MAKNDDALITDNQDLEQSATETPVESAEQTPEVNETNWEESAKFFQSEKDKMYAENKKLQSELEKHKALGEFVDSRTDVQEYLTNAVKTPQVQEQLDVPVEFDPWEAYNDPNSESFQYRTEMEKRNIEQAVAQVRNEVNEQSQSAQKAQRFDSDLTKEGLSEEEKSQFYQFANTPINQLGTDALVRMWRAADSSYQQGTSPHNPELAVAQRVQKEPTPVGVLQGEQPAKANESDAMWDGIMKAAERTNII